MKRKIISIICVLGIMLTFSLTVFADEWNAPKVSLEVSYNNSENTVTLKVIVGAFADLGAFQVKVNYPDDKFTVASAPAASDLLPDPYIDYESVPGKVTYLWSDVTSPSNASDTTLLTIVLNVKDGVEGQAEFSLSDMDFADSTGEYELEEPGSGSVTRTNVDITPTSSSGSSSDNSSSGSSSGSNSSSSGSSDGSNSSSSGSSGDNSSSGSSSGNNSSSSGSTSDNSSSSAPSSQTEPSSSQPPSSEKPASSEPAGSSGTSTSTVQSDEIYTGDSVSPLIYILVFALLAFGAIIFVLFDIKVYRRLAK